MRRVPLALRIVTHDRVRLFWSICGIAFGVFLMFVQMGFMNGIYDSITVLVDALDADLIMINRMKEDMFPMEPFPRARLSQARGVAGIAGVYPIYIQLDAGWRNARDGRSHPIRVVAFEPEDPVWLLPRLQEQARSLMRPETCLLDAASRDNYGERVTGAHAELEGRRIRVAGTFELGPDLWIDGTLVTSRATYLSYLGRGAGGADEEWVELGVLRLEPGASPDSVIAALDARLLDDVVVLTKEEMIRRVHRFWQRNQPVGAVFIVGMIVGFLIGVMICYQILFNDILDLLPQYATLKAIGYRDRFLVSTVFQQAVFLGLAAFAAGGVASAFMYRLLQHLTGLQMWLTPARIGLIFLLTLVMCLISAALAIRKVLASDPAELF